MAPRVFIKENFGPVFVAGTRKRRWSPPGDSSSSESDTVDMETWLQKGNSKGKGKGNSKSDGNGNGKGEGTASLAFPSLGVHPLYSAPRPKHLVGQVELALHWVPPGPRTPSSPPPGTPVLPASASFPSTARVPLPTPASTLRWCPQTPAMPPAERSASTTPSLPETPASSLGPAGTL